MNREQKAAFIDDVAERVEGSTAIFAIDYRGISVPQVAELRAKLGEADASFQVVKNTLTSLALDKADGAGKTGSTDLKEFLAGPTAFTYVRGDIALAAKTIANFKKEHELLEFKGGTMEGQVITAEQFLVLTKLPSRDVLNGQLVGMLAAPITGLVRTLNALIGGLAVQLGQIAEQGLVPVAGSAPAAEQPADEVEPEPEAPVQAEAPAEDPAPDPEASSDEATEISEDVSPAEPPSVEDETSSDASTPDATTEEPAE